jgi:glycosyltransferase involved in cell wall biosynthesis
MSAPLVSIVTPAYNAAPYIGATARSVLAQSYANWEWLIVDDGSTDNTADIAEAIGDPRVRLIKAAHSGLPAVGRNRGIAEARGKYVALLDADDLWEPEKLALQVAYLERQPEVGLVFSRFYLWVDSHRRPREVVPNTRGLPNPGSMLRQIIIRNPIGTSSVIVRRQLLTEIGAFDEDSGHRGTEDFELWLRLAGHTPFGFVEQPLYWYRVHSNNLSGSNARLMSGHLLALDKTFNRHPELYEHRALSGTRMAARRLRWRGYGQLYDCAGDCGRRDLAQSLKIWPFDVETWFGLALSSLGPRALRGLRQISRLIH